MLRPVYSANALIKDVFWVLNDTRKHVLANKTRFNGAQRWTAHFVSFYLHLYQEAREVVTPTCKGTL